VALAACGGDGDSTVAAPACVSPASPPSSSSGAVPSTSPAFDACADLNQVGDLVRSVRKGTETDDEQIASIDDLRDTIESYDETVSDRETFLQVLVPVAVALGRLEVAIDAAGLNYRDDPVVKLISEAVSYTGGAAALKLGCTP
jgi:hypothetical protein